MFINYNQKTSGPVNAHLTPGPGIYFNACIYVYSPGQGQTIPWGQILMSTEIPYHFAHLLPVKKISLKSDFLPFLCVFFHIYIAPGSSRQPIGDKNFYDNRKALSLCPYVASYKMISSKSDFIRIFNDFIHVYSPVARAENPLGTNFWCQQKPLVTLTICCKFRMNLFEFWFYTHFLMFFHIYIAQGQGQTTLCGQTPWVRIFILTKTFCHSSHLL